MYSVTVDSSVIAIPSATSERAAVDRYVDTLLDWGRLLEEEWISLHMSQYAATVLVQDGLYPERSTLRALFLAKGITEYDANTVVRVTEQLLSVTPTLEDYFHVQNVLTEQMSTDPDISAEILGQETTSDLTRCLVLLALLQNYCKHPVRNHTMVLRHGALTGELVIQAFIHEVEHERDDLCEFPIAPEGFHSVVKACSDFRGFVAGIDHVDAWTSAQDDGEQRAAMRIFLYQTRLRQGDEPEWESTPVFCFGTEFLARSGEVCANVGSVLVGKLLRSMVETLLRQKMNDVHALRENRGGGAPQRKRGDDKAWRRDIDREFHLHYWEREQGLIEFGWIGPHNDERLPV